MIRGRPIKALFTIVGGWTALRLAMILPVPMHMPGTGPQFADATPNRKTPASSTGSMVAASSLGWMFPARPGPVEAFAALPVRTAANHPATHLVPPARSAQAAPSAVETAGSSGGGWSAAAADSVLGAQLAFARAPRGRLALAAFVPGAGLSPRESGLPGPPPIDKARTDRWSGAAWMIWRDDSGDAASLSRGARLGASQAGVRVDYALAPTSSLRPAAYGRLSSALQNPAAVEAAAGIAIRPRLPIPVTFAVERREGLSRGGRSDFAILAAGGIDRTEIGHGFTIDGYGQAGMVGTKERDAFIDGRVTVERRVAGAPDLAIGAGVWGGAQPGASRLDVGPQASYRIKLAGAHFRLGAEWREKVAGDASPTSGPAISIGTDF